MTALGSKASELAAKLWWKPNSVSAKSSSHFTTLPQFISLVSINLQQEQYKAIHNASLCLPTVLGGVPFSFPTLSELDGKALFEPNLVENPGVHFLHTL